MSTMREPWTFGVKAGFLPPALTHFVRACGVGGRRAGALDRLTAAASVASDEESKEAEGRGRGRMGGLGDRTTRA